MLKRVKLKVNGIKEKNVKRKEERTRIAAEIAEEEVKKERARIQVEKDALMLLCEKELIVEAILVLKGFNTRLYNMEKKQDNLKETLDSIESKVDSIYLASLTQSHI